MRIYWLTWGVLLILTLTMLLADAAAVPRVAIVVFMLAAMLTKASIIGSVFMHLRHESVWIVVTVVVGLVVTGTVLYVLIIPDAARVHAMLGAR